MEFEPNPNLFPPHLQTPKLFLLGELSGETKHGIFDPIKKKLITLDLPELGSNLQCISSGHGWLLLLSRQENPEESSLFFFNPQTRAKIDIPCRTFFFSAAVFTEPPTSPSCTLFAVTSCPTFRSFIDVLHVGKDKHWTRYFHVRSGNQTEVFDGVSRAVSCGGKLFCVDFKGKVGIFDVNNGSWNVIRMVDEFQKLQITYLAESKGRIFGGSKGMNGVDKVLELKSVNGYGCWREVENMDDMMAFLGDCGSLVLSGLDDNVEEDRVFVGRDDPQSKCESKGARHELADFGWSYSSIWF